MLFGCQAMLVTMNRSEIILCRCLHSICYITYVWHMLLIKITLECSLCDFQNPCCFAKLLQPVYCFFWDQTAFIYCSLERERDRWEIFSDKHWSWQCSLCSLAIHPDMVTIATGQVAGTSKDGKVSSHFKFCSSIMICWPCCLIQLSVCSEMKLLCS